MDYIPDYIDQFNEYEERQQNELDRLPRCCECDEPILTDECYEFNGDLICPDCLKDNHRKYTDDYIE